MTEKEMLVARALLDQLGAELIMRAANLDKLAEQIERHAVALDRRERVACRAGAGRAQRGRGNLGQGG